MEGEKKESSFELDLSVDKKFIFLGLLIVFVLSIVGSQGNPFEQLNLGLEVGTQTPLVIGITPTQQQYRGSLEVNVLHRDALDTTETRVEEVDLVTTFYKKRTGGDYFILARGDNAGVTVTDDRLYFTVVPISDKLYISPYSILNLNPRVIAFEYGDIDHDGMREWIFTYDTTGMPVQPFTMPTTTLITASYEKGNLVLNSPSDINVSVGNSITNIDWEIDVQQEQVVPVTRVELVLHTTDETKIEESSSWIVIPYMDNLELTEMDKRTTTDKIIYVFDIGGNLGGANYIATPQNADSKHPMTARLHVHLEENENLDVELRVTSITPSENFTTTLDKVTLIPSN